MDSQSTATEPKQSYQPVASWSRGGIHRSSLTTPRTPSSTTFTSAAASSELTPTSPYPPNSPFPPNLDLLTPLLFSQHQAQLLHYNKLIFPGRGGGIGLQPSCAAGLPAIPNVQAAPRSRSRSRASPKVLNKDDHSSKQTPAAQNCHGTRGFKNTERNDREGMTMEKDQGLTSNDKSKAKGKGKAVPEMPHLKTQSDLARDLPSRLARAGPQSQQLATGNPTHSSSVPSTPHQRPRNFSSASRDPSPPDNQIPSPRSIYSEPNGGVASAAPRQVKSVCRFETAQAFFQRRMPYSLGPECLGHVDPDKIKSKLSKEDERKLSTDMRELYDRLLPSSEVEENREKLVQKLERIFNDEWPGHNIRVHRFGSSGNLLCSDDSDVDICITTDWKEMEGVCIIADLLARRGMEKVVCVSQAKVPIVKIWDPALKLNCDMNVNNTLALENTRMIRTYVEIDDRVRPLAMVLKYWTRRRVVNDAAYGATLSSYTWICMIVAFLQLRDPPVLPALHQVQHARLPTTDGHTTEFADDLGKLRGWGEKNKSTIGELLFQFFRFFAHEFDYDNQVLSVRLGKMIHKKDKTEKDWQHFNNFICVEEPFNRVRNLGNTADEFSFRGLQMEMRRAFDLVAVAKLDECCEQFVFPKHEPTEKAFVKPSARPIMLRSASQTQPNRGGRNGGRGGRNYRNGNSSRRASSSNAYENAPTSAPAAAAAGVPHSLLPQGHEMSAADLQQWQAAQHPYYPVNIAMLSNALMAQQAQQDRFQGWYAHQQAQLHAIHQAQRAQSHAASTGRSRTNSFDQPPLTAPPRPEYFPWPPQLQHLYAAHAAHAAQQYQSGYGTYPSSPSTTVPSDYRRSMHRSNAGNEGGSLNGGALRSQSQPASRTPAPGGQSGSNYAASTQTVNGASRIAQRQSNLSPFPAFAADERTDSEADDTSNRTLPESPPEEDNAGYLGYFIPERSARKPANVVLALRDVSSSGTNRRRMSTEGPQSVLDRRLQRTSRSPSPLGHGRNVSAGAYSAPLACAPLSQNGLRSAKESSPLVVNGSTFMPPATTLGPITHEAAYENPLHISQGNTTTGATTPDSYVMSTSDRPLVVNGSTAGSPALSRNIGAMPFAGSLGQLPAPSDGSNGVFHATGFGDPSPNKGKSVPRNQNAIHQKALGHLDLAVSNSRLAEPQHLSPVYEHRTPTPTTFRDRPYNQVAASDEAKVVKAMHKSAERNGTTKATGILSSTSTQGARVNGHTPRESAPARAAKNDADSEWQQPKSRKKQAASGKSGKPTTQSEKPPKDSLERKGG